MQIRRMFLAVFVMLTLCSSASGSFRDPDITIGRSELGEAIDPWNLYVVIDVFRSQSTGVWIRCVILEDEPLSDSSDKQQDQITKQITPIRYEWDLEGRLWIAGFLKNRDGTFHTIVSLSDDDLASSVLRIVLPKSVAGKDRVWPVVIAVDMADFDWSPTMEWRRQ